MRCIYADPDNLNKFNKSDSGLLAQMYLQLSKSGGSVAQNERHCLTWSKLVAARGFFC